MSRRRSACRSGGAKGAAAVVAAVVLATSIGAVQARERRPATIGDLAPRKVEVRRDAQVPASASRAMENYRRYLELRNADPKARAEALRRLGDLNLEAGELERMEQEVSAIDLAGAEAIKLYGTLLKAYPDYPRNDQVLYQLARAYETTGQPEQALATLDRIVGGFPGFAQMDEVQFRRGEILFSAKRYPEAQRAYEASIASPDRGGFRDQSQYKLGWSLFKQSLNEESLAPFSRVLDANLVDPRQPQKARAVESLPRADRELVEDTLRVMAITFSYVDGPKSLDAFVSNRPLPPYTHLLYSRLGDLYVEKQRYQDAADAYRAYVNRDPNNDFAPLLAMQAIEAYRVGGFQQLVLDGKREYIERYNFASPFWQGRQRSAYPKVVAELKTNIKDVATFYHATAQSSKKIEDFQVAARWYRDYLNSFPDDPDSAATNYLLGETLFESRQFAESAVEYERTAYQYPKNERSAAAGYASLVAFQRERERLTGEAQAAWHLRQIDASIRFSQTFPDHPDSGGVITRAAQDVFALNDLPRAIEVANLVLAHQPAVDAPKQRIAWGIIAQSNFDLERFDQAEPAFIRARDLLPPNDPLRKDFTERLAASIYKQGEAKRAAGDGAAAVDDFLRVASLAPDAGIRSTAEFDAAAQLVQLKSWERAIGVLEAYRRDYPKDARQREVTRNLAVAYGETGRAGQAAVEFEKISLDPQEDRAVQREALLSAADLFEKSGNAPRTVALLERFVSTYPTPIADSIEARQRLADLSVKANNLDRQRYWFREIVKADGTAGAERTDRTRFLAARAQLALAEPARDEFRAIKLVAPLKRSLDAKRKALDVAMRGYRLAADYRIASVTTAATFEMADLYRRLGQDLMKSERPKGLSAEEREQYDTLLEEQSFPFEEQAIELHQVNAARVREGIYDESVRRSFSALAELKPARFGKTELRSDIVTDIDPVAPPRAAPGARAVADFQRALEAFRAGRITDAELEFSQLAAAHPELAGPRINLGLIRRAAGDLDAAEKTLREAAEAASRSAVAWTELGVTLRMRGKFQEARAAYERALEADPEHATAHRNLGVLQDLYLDEPVAALASLERYRSLAADDKTAGGWVAELRQRVGRQQPPAAPASGGTDASAQGTAPPQATEAEPPAGGA